VVSLSKAQLEALWRHYADYERQEGGATAKALPLPDALTDKSPALRMLCIHLCDAVMHLYRQTVQANNASIAPKSLEQLVAKERAFMLPPGNVEDPAKNAKAMMREMLKAMDISGSGTKLTRTAFIMQWNTFAARWFKVREDGPLDCSIM
jgi:hypothetical protein